MKLFIALFAAALLSSSAFARPGETITQWMKRFEDATQTPADNLGIYVQLNGRKSGIYVKALSQKSAVIYECYTDFIDNHGDREHNSSAEIDAVLKSLSDGKPWKVVTEQKEYYSRGVWTFGAWTAEYDDGFKGKLRVYSAQWPTCKLRNTPGWEHYLPIDSKAVTAPPPKLGL